MWELRWPKKRGRSPIVGAVLAIAPFVLGVTAFHEPSQRRSLRDWIAWRDAQIATIFEPHFTVLDELYLDRSELYSRCASAWNTLKTASPDVLARPEMTHFAAFVRAQSWSSFNDAEGKASHALGLEISDRDYWAESRSELEFPDLLKSQKFLECMADPSGYADAADMIEAQNAALPDDRKWLVLPYLAQFIRSVDRTTYGRMLILVPNVPDGAATIDKWINFAIATPDQKPAPSVLSVSMVAVKSTSDRAKSQAYMMDFMRLRNPVTREFRLEPSVLFAKGVSKNCYECHKSAVIPILPETEYSFAHDGKLEQASSNTAALFNQRIRVYGRTIISHQSAAAYGPSIGQATRTRADQFIRAAFGEKDVSQRTVERIRAAMRCSECHDSFAPINFIEPVRSDRDLKSFRGQRGLAQTMVEEGIMPPGNNLTKAERAALWRALTLEYLDLRTGKGAFVEWLKGQ